MEIRILNLERQVAALKRDQHNEKMRNREQIARQIRAMQEKYDALCNYMLENIPLRGTIKFFVDDALNGLIMEGEKNGNDSERKADISRRVEAIGENIGPGIDGQNSRA